MTPSRYQWIRVMFLLFCLEAVVAPRVREESRSEVLENNQRLLAENIALSERVDEMTAHIATLERQKLNLLARLQVGRLTPQVSPLDQIVDKALDHGAGRQILQVNATDFEGTTQVPIETSAPFHTTAVTAAVTAADVAAPENSTSEVAAGATPSATTNQGGNTDSGVETTARMATPQPTNPVEVVTPQGYELSVKTKLTGVTLVEFEANVLSFETQVALLFGSSSITAQNVVITDYVRNLTHHILPLLLRISGLTQTRR